MVINENEISDTILLKAYELAQGIDLDDAIFIALTMAIDAILWTGDIKLLKGLRRKGFKNVTDTKDFKNILKGL